MKTMMDLNELQYFVHVCEKHSFTAAAKRLGVPKSTISRGLKRLEERLGVRLLQRTTRHVILTEEGNVYFRHCQRALKEAEQAELELSGLRDHPQGCLRLAATTMFVHTFLGPLLGEFLARYPALRLELSVHTGTLKVDLLEAKLDLLIQTGPIEDSRLFVKHLGNIRRALYCSPSYASTHGMPDMPGSLAAHACITSGWFGEVATWSLRHGRETEELTITGPRVSMVSVDPMVRRQLVVAGVGIAILPRYLAAPFEQERQLIQVLPDWEPRPGEMYALYPAPLSQSPKVRAFLNWLEPHFLSCSEVPTRSP